MIPVVFIHQGNQEYLSIALEQAAIRNGVVLLGDNDTLWRNFDHMADLLAVAKDFDQAYVHMSTNPEPFERFCFHRWFALAEWMRRMRAERAFYCDSDVMLYCDVTEWAESVGNPDVSLQIPKHQPEYRWAASGHVSLWTLDALSAFCNYIVAIYQESSELLEAKWHWHQTESKPGGICDMTLLYLWASDTYRLGLFHPTTKIVNNAKVINGATFDHNINVAENYELDEYEMEAGHKRLWLYEDWNDSRPVLGRVVTDSRERVFANALHFQGGPTKELMKEYKG